MQNPVQKFIQSSIVFQKPGIFPENLKTLTSSNYPTVQYFLLKICTHVPLTNVYKDLVSTHSFCTLLLSTQDLNKIKKHSSSFCRHYYAENVCKISAKNIKFYGSWNYNQFHNILSLFNVLPSFPSNTSETMGDY